MKIAFFGTPQIAGQVLERLIGSDYQPQLVITGQDQHSGRSLALKANAVKLVAEKHNIEISYKMSDIKKNFDLAILVAYGRIIPDEVLRLPKFGFVNVHPSYLPKYRGPSPITAPILAGNKTTGVSLIVLDSELDHGPILAQKEIDISPSDTHDSLAAKLANVGSELLLKTLPQYLDQNITPQAQDHDSATYTQKITKESGKIDINNPPDNVTLDRMIRAYFPWPTVWCTVKVNSEKSKGKELRIQLLPNPSTKLSNYQSTDLILIQPEGKKPMTKKEFLNGYPNLKSKIENLFKQ